MGALADFEQLSINHPIKQPCSHEHFYLFELNYKRIYLRIEENGIRKCVTGNTLIAYRYLSHLFHIHRITEYAMGVNVIRYVREAFGNSLYRRPNSKGRARDR